jgi:hypothetical protein
MDVNRLEPFLVVPGAPGTKPVSVGVYTFFVTKKQQLARRVQPFSLELTIPQHGF